MVLLDMELKYVLLIEANSAWDVYRWCHVNLDRDEWHYAAMDMMHAVFKFTNEAAYTQTFLTWK